jgi:hypothetical protein
MVGGQTAPIKTIEEMLARLEVSIAGFPDDLQQDFAQAKATFHWAKGIFGSEASDIKGLRGEELALIHRLVFAAAFVASVSSLPGRDIEGSGLGSTEILDAVASAGLPPREFLNYYAKYGNEFTWKLLKLTGRIGGSKDQPAPALVEGV